MQSKRPPVPAPAFVSASFCSACATAVPRSLDAERGLQGKVSVSLVVFIATSREQAEIETLSVGLLANLNDGPSLSVGLRLTCSAAELRLRPVPTFTSRGTAQARCGFREGRDGDRAGRPCGVWSRTRAVLAILQHLFGRTGACRRAYRFCSSDCNTHLRRYT